VSGALELAGVDFAHPGRPVLRDVSLACAPGERLAVLGRSGAGKTTLLRVVAGLVAPAAGVVRLGGAEASTAGRVVVPPEARGVGLVFQDLALWSHMSVAAHLAFAAHGTRGERRARAAKLAATVGLGDRLAARPGELSGGEQQRLALARALAPDPAVLLLDEPFAQLDRPLRDGLVGELLDLVQGRVTVVLVTHQARDVFDLAERVVVLAGGRPVESGSVAGVAAAPRHAETVALLGLGAVVAGELRAGRLETPLGPLEVAGEPGPDGPRTALVRPGQAAARRAGAGAGHGVVRRAATAPGDAGSERRVLVATDAGPELWAAAGPDLAAGDRVALEVGGPCHLLVAEAGEE